MWACVPSTSPVCFLHFIHLNFFGFCFYKTNKKCRLKRYFYSNNSIFGFFCIWSLKMWLKDHLNAPLTTVSNSSKRTALSTLDCLINANRFLYQYLQSACSEHVNLLFSLLDFHHSLSRVLTTQLTKACSRSVIKALRRNLGVRAVCSYKWAFLSWLR